MFKIFIRAQVYVLIYVSLDTPAHFTPSSKFFREEFIKMIILDVFFCFFFYLLIQNANLKFIFVHEFIFDLLRVFSIRLFFKSLFYSRKLKNRS